MICLQFRPGHLVLRTLPNPFLDSAISFWDPNEPSRDPHKSFVDPKGPYGDPCLTTCGSHQTIWGPHWTIWEPYWTMITRLKTLTRMKVMRRRCGDQWNGVVDGMTITIIQLLESPIPTTTPTPTTTTPTTSQKAWRYLGNQAW